MKLLVATRSRGKQAEVRRLLDDPRLTVCFPDDLGLPESPDEARLERSDSYETNARAKAEHFHRLTGLVTVGDDSGLEVLALGGAPGVRSKRWTGARGTAEQVDAANKAELLRRLAGLPAAKRTARFRCVLVLVRSSALPPERFEGTCAGRILEAPEGAGGFGYDPLFWSADLAKGLGVATDDEKNRVSHRARAFSQLRAALLP